MGDKPIAAALAALYRVKVEVTDMYREDQLVINNAIAALQRYEKRENRN